MLRYFFKPSPPPLPPSLRPPSPISGATPSMHLKESYEIRETLVRLEQKMDILLAKFNSLEQRKKFATVTVTTETPEKIVKKEPKPIPTFGDARFKDELIRRVEELRAIKRMGESHGFGPTVPIEGIMSLQSASTVTDEEFPEKI